MKNRPFSKTTRLKRVRLLLLLICTAKAFAQQTAGGEKVGQKLGEKLVKNPIQYTYAETESGKNRKKKKKPRFGERIRDRSVDSRVRKNSNNRC